MGSFRVSVSKDYLGFAAAHFLTFRGHECESLHGHNYRVGVTIEGPVEPECRFVVDFAVLKEIIRNRVDVLDHRVLLPAKNPKLQFREAGGMTFVDYHGTQTYQFPTKDCMVLPITNSTAEMIAEWLAHAVRSDLDAAGAVVDVLEVEVEESAGQRATYTERCSQHQPEHRTDT